MRFAQEWWRRQIALILPLNLKGHQFILLLRRDQCSQHFFFFGANAFVSHLIVIDAEPALLNNSDLLIRDSPRRKNISCKEAITLEWAWIREKGKLERYFCFGERIQFQFYNSL